MGEYRAEYRQGPLRSEQLGLSTPPGTAVLIDRRILTRGGSTLDGVDPRTSLVLEPGKEAGVERGELVRRLSRSESPSITDTARKSAWH